jgi:cellulose biosynthesis protein BcsQ
MKTLATYSIKGGVGKTAAAVNLSHAAADSGLRTLVWDLDPQGAASYSFRIKPRVKGGAKAVVRGKRPLDDAIRGTDFDELDLVPADFSYRHLDLLLDQQKKPTRLLRRLLRPMETSYDIALLDCPPSISLASESVLDACDALLVPLIPTPLSLRTLEQLSTFIERHGVEVQILAFWSMVDTRRRLHREIMASITDAMASAPTDFAASGVRAVAGPWADAVDVLETMVPYSATVERVSVERAPVAAFAPRTSVARAFAALWDEVEAKLA